MFPTPKNVQPIRKNGSQLCFCPSCGMDRNGMISDITESLIFSKKEGASKPQVRYAATARFTCGRCQYKFFMLWVRKQLKAVAVSMTTNNFTFVGIRDGHKKVFVIKRRSQHPLRPERLQPS